MSAPHTAPTPSEVAVDLSRLYHLSRRLAPLAEGAPASASVEPSAHDTTPDRLHRAEALVERGVSARARAAWRLVNALDAPHRPVARWVATDAPPGMDAAKWPVLLARAIGPRDLTAAVEEGASLVKLRKLELEVARMALRARANVASARALDAARKAHGHALERYGGAVTALDAWGRVRFAALLVAVDEVDAASAAAA